MTSDSYANQLEDVLKDAREAPIPEPAVDKDEHERIAKLRAAALVTVLTMIDVTDERGSIGRQSGSPWTQDHRRSRMGYSNLMRARSRRSTWR
ncbi:MAG: hypothetical protein QGF94_02650 [Candidatus Thalassarchaeaceae archaeon]|nr:hypothetical protein [Candidatus Thalassarchaeaceae archaeon]